LNSAVLRIEWYRWVRTRQLVALTAAFALFAFTSLFGAKYLPELLRHSAQIQLLHAPDWRDGLQQYVKNAGLLLTAICAAMTARACNVRGTDPIGIYYLSRETSAARLFLPRFVVSAVIVGVTALLGACTALYECHALFGSVPIGVAARYLAVQWIAMVLFAQFAGALAARTGSTGIASALTTATYVTSLILAAAPAAQPYLPTTALQPSITTTRIATATAAKPLATLLALTVIASLAALTTPIRTTRPRPVPG
jgi:ABC-type transport system involved in multi-copper enzyme maturation permease subunit